MKKTAALGELRRKIELDEQLQKEQLNVEAAQRRDIMRRDNDLSRQTEELRYGQKQEMLDLRQKMLDRRVDEDRAATSAREESDAAFAKEQWRARNAEANAQARHQRQYETQAVNMDHEFRMACQSKTSSNLGQYLINSAAQPHHLALMPENQSVPGYQHAPGYHYALGYQHAPGYEPTQKRCRTEESSHADLEEKETPYQRQLRLQGYIEKEGQDEEDDKTT